MRIIQSLFLIILVLGCQPDSAQEVTIKAADRSPLPDKARLTLLTNPNQLELGKNEFHFEVTGYELGVSTASLRATELANSDKGQHIHHILDNKPYMARYLEGFTLDLDTGHHVLLSFLARAYHESVKSSDAFVVNQFQIGGTKAESYDLKNGQHLFFSRPKGNYTIQEGQSGSILLDFYLLNTDLSDGSYVKAVLDGEVFLLRKWTPYYINGLTVGEHMISLQLMNNKDEPIEGPFNFSGIRKFTISKSK